MKNLKKLAVAVAAAGALALSLPAPAFAINRVDCGNRTDFLKIITTFQNFCFANAGTMNVDIRNVVDFSTGNNDVTISYVATNGSTQEIGVRRNQTFSSIPERRFAPPIDHIFRVHIR